MFCTYFSLPCNNLLIFDRKFRDELTNNGVTDVDVVLEKEFAAWFKNHVRDLTDVPDDLHTLAMGPEKRVLVHNACNVNGARFRTVDREKNLRTQNSGVMNVAALDDQPETEFYGVLKEVIELRYRPNKHGERSIFLFRCDWYDLKGKTTGIRDDGYYKSVNTTTLWYKNAPFILARQAKTCFYLEDTKLGHPWKVVQTFSHRNVYDVPETDEAIEDVEEINKDAYQEDNCSTGRIVNDIEPEEEEGDVQDDSVARQQQVNRIARRIRGELEREVAVANQGAYNSEDEHEVVQPEENTAATSDADTDLDD